MAKPLFTSKLFGGRRAYRGERIFFSSGGNAYPATISTVDEIFGAGTVRVNDPDFPAGFARNLTFSDTANDAADPDQLADGEWMWADSVGNTARVLSTGPVTIAYTDLTSFGAAETAQIQLSRGLAPAGAYGSSVEVNLETDFDFPGSGNSNLMDVKVGTASVPNLLMGGGQFGLILNNGQAPLDADGFGAGGPNGSLGGQLGSAPTLSVAGQAIYATFTMPSGIALSTLTAGSVTLIVRIAVSQAGTF